MCVLVCREWRSLFKWIEHCVESVGGKIEQDALMKLKGSQKAGLQRGSGKHIIGLSWRGIQNQKQAESRSTH